MMHRRVGVERDQRAIAGQRLPHLALAQQRRALRLKVDQNRGAGDQIGHFVAQRGCLGHGVAALDGIEGQVRQHHSVLFGGKFLRQQRGTERNGRVLGQLLGHKSGWRDEAIIPLGGEGGIQPPVLGARLFWLVGTCGLLFVGIVFLLQLIGQELEERVHANGGLRAFQFRIAALGLLAGEGEFERPRKIGGIGALNLG